MADTPIYLDRFVQRFVETIASLHLGTRDWILIIAIFVLGFSYLLSRAVGWREVAMHYATGDRFQGERIALFDSDGEEYEVELLLNNSSVSENSIKLGADGKGIISGPGSACGSFTRRFSSLGRTSQAKG